MFAGDYKIILNKGNYIPQDTIDFRINKGKNYKVFEVSIPVVWPKSMLNSYSVKGDTAVFISLLTLAVWILSC